MIAQQLIESDILKNSIKGIGLLNSFLIFGIASTALVLETQFLIPFLSKRTGLEPIIFWFIVAGFGIFLPMLVLAYFLLRSGGVKISKNTWEDRLRFKKMNKADWLWSIGSIIMIGLFSFAIIKLLEVLIGKVESNPSFMYFEPLTADRYWILLLWFPYWLLNIFGGVLFYQNRK
ncbi:MAG: hypothetical protein K8R79_00540 [Calditrichales bacterium]|nr:hypothetical protein [Calditrichales bacterium]